MERSVASERRRADGLSRYALGSSLQGANIIMTYYDDTCFIVGTFFSQGATELTGRQAKKSHVLQQKN